MNSTKDKIKGHANSTAGKMKVAVGKLTDSNSMRIKGEAQKIKGEAQMISGGIKASVDKGLKNLNQASKK